MPNPHTLLLGCIGSLYEYLWENFALARNPGIKLTQTLAALSNRNRFNIIAKLLDGPAYGRELASFVGISPVTISQHISILLSANLITMHNVGTKHIIHSTQKNWTVSSTRSGNILEEINNV